jgi:hypothetical protein
MLEDLTLSQKEGESVADYASRAKPFGKCFRNYHRRGGSKSRFKDKSLAENTKLNDKAMEMLVAYNFSKNSDPKRFRDSFKDLSKS